MSNQEFILYVSIPLIIGGIIALINNEGINARINGLSNWLIEAKKRNTTKSHWFNRYLKKPVFWIFEIYLGWTADLSHGGLQSGIRLAMFIYISICWLALLVALAFFAIQLVIIGFVLYLVYLLLVQQGVIGRDEETTTTQKAKSRTLGLSGKNERINPETGEIEEEGLFGYSKTDRRVNPKTGKVQEKGIFGWQDTAVKVDQSSGEIQEEGLFGYEEAETKIDPESGIIKKKGLLGWEETDYRINPKTGKQQKKGIFGWDDV